MGSPQLRTDATCRDGECEWAAEGATADKQAEKHVKATGHPVATVTRREG